MSHAAKRHFLSKWDHWLRQQELTSEELKQVAKEMQADVEEMLAASQRTWESEAKAHPLAKVLDRLERSLGFLPPGERYNAGEHAHWQGQEIGAALIAVLTYLMGQDTEADD